MLSLHKKVQSLARILLFILCSKKPATLFILQFKGFSDGMLQDGLKQNSPIDCMGFDTYNGLRKHSETTCIRQWKYMLHVSEMEKAASDINAFYFLIPNQEMQTLKYL